MNDAIRIEVLPPTMMGFPISWAKAEGWNPGIDDQSSFYAADNTGFLACVSESEVLATISAVSYGKEFGFIGFYIVTPGQRGRGYGRLVWKAALEKLKGATIGLDGVIAQQDFYRRSGFELAHRNIRFQGRAEKFSLCDISAVTDSHFESLFNYDNRHFGYPRKDFLSEWLRQKNGFSFVFLKNSQIKGYGVIRKCFTGYKIGPLFADDYFVAESILQGLISSIPEGETFFLDIPEPNDDAQKLVKRHNMHSVFETARMYLGKAPKLPLNNIFGITSFELG